MIKNEDLRTPWRVRLIVGLIAVALLGSTMALYLTVFVQYGNQPDITATDTSELEQRYEELAILVEGYRAEFSEKYFEQLMSYKSEVKGFNEVSLEKVEARDLKRGDGREIDTASDPYLAFYIGWKPDEEILDSSFDDFASPTGLRVPLPGSTSMIEGWLQGIVGMQIGGVREISIPSDFAYKEGALKFIVMLIPYEEEQLANILEFNEVYQALMMAQYGE